MPKHRLRKGDRDNHSWISKARARAFRNFCSPCISGGGLIVREEGTGEVVVETSKAPETRGNISIHLPRAL